MPRANNSTVLLYELVPGMMRAYGVERLASHPTVSGVLSIAAGSVVDFCGCAVVNAANEGGVTGGGVDGAINAKGGRELIDARKALPILPGTHGKRILTGGATSTIAGGLRSKWVVRIYPGLMEVHFSQ